MAIKRERKIIGSADRGIALTVLTDSKFKTDSYIIHFITRLTEENASANAAIAFMLEDTCAKYPTITAFNTRLAELYGASVRGGISRFADSQTITMSASCIGDRYALEGEEISAAVLELLCGCIFEPVSENGAFPEKQFALKKQELIDDIDADINDKRSYALKKAGKVIYENEPAGIPVKGERSDAEALTSEQVWKAYKELLRTARIEIFFVGRELPEKCEKLINDRFSAMDRGAVYSPSEKLSPLKPEVRYETERLDVLQSKMVMAYKTSIKSPAVRRVFTALFGGLPVSMLFMNVREKLSLCYYCAASFAEKSGVMFVDSGVENENIEPARREIENQLALTAKGEFSDELLEQAKLAMVCALKGADDSPRNIADWYFSDCTKSEEDILSPEKLSELIEKVTKKQVMEFAASLKLDTVYVLTGKEN